MFNFGLRGHYPSRYPPNPDLIRDYMLINLNFLEDDRVMRTIENYINRNLAREILSDLRDHDIQILTNPSLSWIKDIVEVKAFVATSRSNAINSLTFTNCPHEDPNAYYFYGILSLKEYWDLELFAVTEYRCIISESNLNLNE